AKAGQLHDACAAAAQAEHDRERARLQEDFDRTNAAIAEQWNRADEVEVEFEQAARDKIETQTPRIVAQIDQFLRPKLAWIASRHDGWEIGRASCRERV